MRTWGALYRDFPHLWRVPAGASAAGGGAPSASRTIRATQARREPAQVQVQAGDELDSGHDPQLYAGDSDVTVRCSTLEIAPGLFSRPGRQYEWILRLICRGRRPLP